MSWQGGYAKAAPMATNSAVIMRSIMEKPRRQTMRVGFSPAIENKSRCPGEPRPCIPFDNIQSLSPWSLFLRQ